MSDYPFRDVLDFWLDEVSPSAWYSGSDELDQQIRDRFMPLWEQAAEGGLGDWLISAHGTLAYVILLDQFSRNMFREDPRAFAMDRHAKAAAKSAIAKGWDMQVQIPARQFFYLPLMHSESLSDQERCMRLLKTRMGAKEDQLLHAKVHREIIRLFGRFPYRNNALSRLMSEPEQAFLDGQGYQKLMAKLSEGLSESQVSA